VTYLGEHMRLPVEILAFGQRWTLERLGDLGLDPRLRAGFVTDGGNVIADCALGAGADLEALAARVKAVTGVVEHGLFLVEATLAYVGRDDGVDRLTR
jgi:ribose 5-phosphate isomerase A